MNFGLAPASVLIGLELTLLLRQNLALGATSNPDSLPNGDALPYPASQGVRGYPITSCPAKTADRSD